MGDNLNWRKSDPFEYDRGSRVTASSTCPICGQDTPHQHDGQTVHAYRRQQACDHGGLTPIHVPIAHNNGLDHTTGCSKCYAVFDMRTGIYRFDSEYTYGRPAAADDWAPGGRLHRMNSRKLSLLVKSLREDPRYANMRDTATFIANEIEAEITKPGPCKHGRWKSHHVTLPLGGHSDWCPGPEAALAQQAVPASALAQRIKACIERDEQDDSDETIAALDLLREVYQTLAQQTRDHRLNYDGTWTGDSTSGPQQAQPEENHDA